MKQLAKLLILKPLYNLLIFFTAIVPGQSIGWGIILLTLLVRVVLYLPTRKSIIAQRKMQELGPEIEALKIRHKDDQQAQAQATMALYKEHGVSPFGSCLPMLVQLPVLFILYYVFRISLDTSRFDLLYVFTPRPETINTHFLWFNLAKIDPFVLPLVAGGLQLIASWQLMPRSAKAARGEPQKQPDVMGSFSKQMMYIFPLMTLFIARRLPAALAIYWITTTAFSIGQQYLLLRSAKVKQEVKKEIAQEEKVLHHESKGGVKVVVRKRKK